MIHYMLLLGYILVTCHKNNIVTLHVTFMLCRRNEICLLGIYSFLHIHINKSVKFAILCTCISLWGSRNQATYFFRVGAFWHRYESHIGNAIQMLIKIKVPAKLRNTLKNWKSAISKIFSQKLPEATGKGLH